MNKATTSRVNTLVSAVASKQKRTVKRPVLLYFGQQDQILFSKRLSMILKSGMPIMQGLTILHEETHSNSARYIYGSLVNDVTHGQMLSSALARFQHIFGEFCINIVRIGETSGTLYENLHHLSEELKRRQALKRKVVGALIYPALIVTATAGITLMLTVFIFPKIVPIFQSVKATLPLSTRILMSVSTFLEAQGISLALALVVGTVVYFFALRLAAFHRLMDSVLLRLPLFGKLSQAYNLANISRTLSLLLRSDVRIMEALLLVANSTKNLAYRDALMEAREAISKGQKISAQFKYAPELYPRLMSQMVTVGEETGNLVPTFAYLSEMYEEEINEITKNLTTLLEPVLMIIMGTVVGFIAISIITPIYSITQSMTPK